MPVRVTSDVPVVAEIRSVSDGEGSRMWTAIGVPQEIWLGPPTRPPVELDPGLPTRVDPSVTQTPTVPPPDADDAPDDLFGDDW